MDARTQELATNFSPASVNVSESIQLRPIIFPVGGLTVLFNITRCFLQKLQANAVMVRPSMPQFIPIIYSLVIIILNSIIR
jgi:hypothetical protein